MRRSRFSETSPPLPPRRGGSTAAGGVACAEHVRGSTVAIFKKVVMMGSFAVGKTSLVRRFVEDAFDDKYLSTMGVKVSRKPLTIDGTALTLMLWDISGREGFEGLRPSYLKGASGAILVGDTTRPRTFGTIDEEVGSLVQAVGAVPRIMCANKSDLAPAIDTGAIVEQAARLDARWFATSARTGDGVEEAFATLGRALLAK